MRAGFLCDIMMGAEGGVGDLQCTQCNGVRYAQACAKAVIAAHRLNMERGPPLTFLSQARPSTRLVSSGARVRWRPVTP